jgi:ariadne-1
LFFADSLYITYAQQNYLLAVMNLFDIKQHHARAVLMRYPWRTETIMDEMDRKGQERMLTEAGVVVVPRQQNDAVAACDAGSQRVTCGVCSEDFSRSNVSTNDCGHFFCND